MKPSTPFSAAQRVSSQRAIVSLAHDDATPAGDYHAAVTRISPSGIRIALEVAPQTDMRTLYRCNPRVDLLLDLPRPLKPVQTQGRISGVAINHGVDEPPMVIDLEFLELTAEEEKALRDSNPALVV